MLRVIRLREYDYPAFGPQIAAIEKGVTYPLGADRFEIDHGEDYFAFFRRLGELRYYVALEGDSIAGVMGAVLRSVDGQLGARAGSGSSDAWYVCDLKAARHRGHAPIARPLLDAFRRDAFASAPDSELAAYAISMNPARGENRLVSLLPRFVSPTPRVAARLLLYSLDAVTAGAVASSLASRFGAHHWLSLAGTKDIVLASTGRPLPLVHLQHGRFAARSSSNAVIEPVPGAAHMFCVPDGDPLVATLAGRHIHPTADATVLSHGLGGLAGASFDFVLTSDI